MSPPAADDPITKVPSQHCHQSKQSMENSPSQQPCRPTAGTTPRSPSHTTLKKLPKCKGLVGCQASFHPLQFDGWLGETHRAHPLKVVFSVEIERPPPDQPLRGTPPAQTRRYAANLITSGSRPGSVGETEPGQIPWAFCSAATTDCLFVYPLNF